MQLSGYLNGCGVYESQIRQPYIKKIVYIGCMCHKRNDQSLEARLSEYTRNGSHKEELIKVALRYEYKIYVRVKKIQIRSDAKIETRQQQARDLI